MLLRDRSGPVQLGSVVDGAGHVIGGVSSSGADICRTWAGPAHRARRLAGFFRDITETRRGSAREHAFAGIAASVAFADSLDDTLDRLAERVVGATSMSACAVTVLDEEPAALRVAGACGLPSDYPDRFQAARRSGVTMPAIAAVIGGESIVVRRASDDPALNPCDSGDLVDATLLCLPMSARGQTVGALKCFYRPEGVPDADGMRFLGAVADQAAVAVDRLPDWQGVVVHGTSSAGSV